MQVLTPQDIMTGITPQIGPVLVYDDDQAYIGGVIAEQLANAGHEVIFVTPANMVSPFTELTLEQVKVQRNLIEAGVEIITAQSMGAVEENTVSLSCTYSGRTKQIGCSSVVLVTERIRETTLYETLRNMPDHGLKTLELIGDAANPGLIADAVYAGHMAARNFERDPEDVEQQFFRRELVSLEMDEVL